ncbi:hypothetical protein [Caballeronia temeraria]|uniref:hypothetical protein n=1 Tax=Caballeronia temeraria TaxID=1777137 RepID=UPI0007728893|nr:hypothetical protein [Caballeronia temeraria]
MPRDLARPDAAQRVVDETLAAFGRIDALLNIAGAVPQIDLFDMTARRKKSRSSWRFSFRPPPDG